MISSLVSLYDTRKIRVPSADVHADKPVFGQYACAGPSGALLRVGDEVHVTERVSFANTPISPLPDGVSDAGSRASDASG